VATQVGIELIYPATTLGARGNGRDLSLGVGGQQAKQLNAGVACAAYDANLRHETNPSKS
jgi:hypothetical protein